MQRFAGKVVVVTGAGSGIGEGTARRFAAEGAMVVLCGRTEAKLRRVAADLDAERTLVQPADVSERAQAEALVAKFRERIPLGRPGEPADVADVIAFLASEDARFVTGVNLPVDGGLSASNGQPRQA